MYAIYYSRGFRHTTLLDLDDEMLQKVVDCYNNGVTNLTLKGRAYNFTKPSEIRFFRIMDEMLYKKLVNTRTAYSTDNLTDTLYIPPKILELVGSDVTYELIGNNEFGYLKRPKEVSVEKNKEQPESPEKIEALHKELKEMRAENHAQKAEILQGQTKAKGEIIAAISEITEAQDHVLWTEIAAIFFEFDTEIDEKLAKQVKEIKNQPSVKSKLELSIPLLKVLGVDYKVEFDVVDWANKMYEKHQLKIFKFIGGI